MYICICVYAVLVLVGGWCSYCMISFSPTPYCRCITMISGTEMDITTIIIMTTSSVVILPTRISLLYHPPMMSVIILAWVCLIGFCGFWPFVVRMNFMVCVCIQCTHVCTYLHLTYTYVQYENCVIFLPHVAPLPDVGFLLFVKSLIVFGRAKRAESSLQELTS